MNQFIGILGTIAQPSLMSSYIIIMKISFYETTSSITGCRVAGTVQETMLFSVRTLCTTSAVVPSAWPK